MTTLFCIDFDETLSNTDRLRADIEAGVMAIGGEELAATYKEAYERVRAEQGTVRMPLVLRETTADTEVHRRLAKLINELPYQDYIYPGSEDAVRHLKGQGKVVLFSDGDAFFQAQKIYATSIPGLVDGVVILPKKIDYFDELEGFYAADKYVFVDDKQKVLDAAKEYFGERATAVLVRQGRYAKSAAESSADYSFDSIGQVTSLF